MTANTFGQWLKQRRKALGLTQKALAKQAGCAEVTLRKIEAGDLQPSAPLVASLAEALGVDDADLPGLVSLARGLEDDFATKARLLRPQRPNNLPAQLTPLIGRSHDITVVRRRLLSDGARLVTLLGPPGVGKTRLALAVAEDVLEQFDGGVFFVRLAPVSDPDQVAAAVAQALGMQMSGPNPPELQLRAYLEEKHLLLVLDNFEQIVAAAPLVDDLLRRCPWLHVLVTSRQPLRVRGERQMAVQPLALPASAPAGSVATAEDMLRYPAVELFADRAEAVLPDFAVDDGNAAAVAELCRRLDGLPLAIELVAARVKLLPPAELLQRLHGPWLLSTDGLRDVSVRQKTLRGAIGWSYDLLSPAEQTLFMYLSVFVGGFTLEAAELLCGDALIPPLPLAFSPTQVLDGIGSLLDKNLIQRETGMYGGTRYVILETMCEYGLERTILSGREAKLRERHASCFLELVEFADKAEVNPRKLNLNRIIDDELHNLRAALEWLKPRDVQATLTLTAHLLRWYYHRGPLTEGKRLIDQVFTLPGATMPTIPKARALFDASILVAADNDAIAARGYAEESLILSQELGYLKGEADATLALGQVAVHQNGWERASFYFEKALTLYQAIGDRGGIAYAKVMLSNSAVDRADFSMASVLAQESLACAREAGFPFHWPLFILANNCFFVECDLDQAWNMYQQLLTSLREDQESIGHISSCLFALGDIATRRGDLALAHVLYDEAFALVKRFDNPQIILRYHLWLAELNQAESNYRQALHSYRAGLSVTLSDPSLRAILLIDLAALAVAIGMYELAATLLGTVDTVEENFGPLSPIHLADYQRVANEARSHLRETRFEKARMVGREQEYTTMAESALSIMEEAFGIENQGLTT